jgi:ribosomal protein S17
MSKKQTKTEIKIEKKTAEIVGTRGRIFEGTVTKKFDNRAVVEFDRMVKVAKYERFMRKTTRIHSRIPQGMTINVGDYVKVQECRPLSKMIHSVVIEVIRPVNSTNEGDKK